MRRRRAVGIASGGGALISGGAQAAAPIFPMTSFSQKLCSRWRTWRGAERAAAAALGLAGGGLLVWAWRLWPEWRHNPDLSHGFLALPAVVLLWIRAREDAAGGARPLRPRPQLAGVTAAGAGLAVGALMTTVYAVALGWAAIPTLFLASVAAAAATALALALAAGPAVRWVAPGWPLVVVLATILLSAPLPPATYARLTAGLQEAITVGVVETLRLVGVPALRSGNVINLGHTSVGVEEACSGVRSLVSCVLAGLVLSALMLRSPWRRLLLAGLAAPLALLGNFARSLTLTLLAREGIDIGGAWHDGLGFAVLILTTVALGAFAVWLEEAPEEAGRGGSREPGAGRPKGGAVAADSPWRTASGTALAALVLTLGWLGYVAARTEASAVSADANGAAVPVLTEIVPARPAGEWAVATRTDLDRFADILQTDHLLERTYLKTNDGGEPVRVTVYVAWWPAGAASVSTVAAHTPEACWPGSGWALVPGEAGRFDLPLEDGRVALGAEQRGFINHDYPQRVWFWHLVGGEPLRPFDPRSWRQQLRLFFQHGVRRDQPQAFVRISSNLPWIEIADESLVAEVLEGFARLGVPLHQARR